MKATAPPSTPWIASVGRALPPHPTSQEAVTAALRAFWLRSHHNPARLEQFHEAVGVAGRHLALPIEAYLDLTDFTKSNQAWIAEAPKVGEAALARALDLAGLEPSSLDHLFFVTVTGLATPTLDAMLVNRMGLRLSLIHI